ncbi:MAG: hypothetical protein GY696_22880 [Gammaproteobacteria bacterium]|nr:hypothetical protein [Gammaproteobacteria bacterium]
MATGTTFEVLTLAEVREVSGWSCEVIFFEWRYRCGVFSHMKLLGGKNTSLRDKLWGCLCG